jgi:hypothetical protein
MRVPVKKKFVNVLLEDREEPSVEKKQTTDKRYDWRYENSINTGKERLILSDQDEKYNPWRTNNILSNYPETVFDANIVNMMYHLPFQMQYDYLFYSVRKHKRFSKKTPQEELDRRKEEEKLIELISEYYKYNIVRSKEVLKILTKEQIEFIRKKQEKGGVK